MFERFTDTTRIAIALANQRRRALGGSQLSDVDLLIGIILQSRGIGHLVLLGIKVDLAALIREVEALPRAMATGEAPDKVPQTRSFKDAIEAAIEISSELRQNYVGTEHLLLGLLRYPDFPSSRVLARFGVQSEKVSAWLESCRKASRE